MGKSFDPMGWGCAGAGREADGCTPRPIVSMSFQLAIPGRVALPQSPPPLHQPGAIMKQRAAAGQQKPANGQLCLNYLSHPRGQAQITTSWHRVKDSNPHRRVWNPQCFRLHQPCAFKLGPEPRPRRGARLRAGSVGLRADVDLTGLGNSQLQPISFTALTRQCLAANHSAPGRFLPANRRNRPLISTSRRRTFPVKGQGISALANPKYATVKTQRPCRFYRAD